MLEVNDKCLPIFKNQTINIKENSKANEWQDELFPIAHKTEIKKLNEIIKSDYSLYKPNMAAALLFSKRKTESNPVYALILTKLSRFPSLFQNCFIDTDITQCFKVKLYIEGKWQIVLLDAFVPYDRVNDAIDAKYLTPIELSEQIWPIVLEKAIAKVSGGYQQYKLLSPSLLFSLITSFPCEKYSIGCISYMDIISILNRNDQCLIITNQKNEHQCCCSVVQTAQAEINEVSEWLLLIESISSLSQMELKEHLSQYNDKLKSLNAMNDNRYNSYWISLKDFSELFSEITLCHFFFDSVYTSDYIDNTYTLFPLTFAFELKEISKVALTFSLQNINERTEISLIIAQISSFDINRIAKVKGFNFAMNDSIGSKDIIIDCIEGQYIFWLSAFDQLKQGYNLRIMSKSSFTISSIEKDNDCMTVKRIIHDAITEDDKVNSGDVVIKKENSFKSSGISYGFIKNPSKDTDYILSSHYEYNTKDYKALVTFSKEGVLHLDRYLIFLFQKRIDANDTIFNESNFTIEKRKIGEASSDKQSIELLTHIEQKSSLLRDIVYHKTIPEPHAFEQKPTLNDNENEANLTKIAFPLSSDSEENDDNHQWTVINYKNAIYLGSILKKNNTKDGRGCLFFSKNNYYVGQWKEDQLNGFGTHYISNKVKEYEGSFTNGKYEGQGIQLFPNNNKYVGQFKEGLFNGQGTLFYSQGNTYEGNFVNGIEEGFGRILFANGDIFEGDFSEGKPNNFGIFTYRNNEGYYKGMFEAGKRKGKGQLKFEGDTIYNGFFDNDQFNGFGVLTYSNGTIYEGYFVEGLRQGRGKLILDDNDYYEGEFAEGEFTGEGTLCIGDSFIFKGTFEKGKFNGQGILNYFNGDIYTGHFSNGLKNGFGLEYLHNGDRYEGNFAKDAYEGIGKFTYAAGNSYEGSFIKGQFEGEGELVFENGDKYEGSFKKGIREGGGYFFFDEGNIYEGEFKDDLFDGQGILYKKNGDIIEGSFIKGLLSGKAVYYPNDDLPFDIEFGLDKCCNNKNEDKDKDKGDDNNDL